jgi:hypothetical protein
MSQGGTVNLVFNANASGVVAAAAQINAALASTASAGTQAGSAVAKSVGTATVSVEKLGDVSGKAGSSAAKMAGALSLVSPQAANAALALADLADVGELAASAGAAVGVSAGVATAAVALLAAALLPIGGALMVMARESAEADARTAFLAQHVGDLAPALASLETALTDAAIATGVLSGAQAAYAKSQDAATLSLLTFQAAQAGERSALEDEAFALERSLRRLDMLPGFLTTAIDYYGGYSSALQETTFKLNKLDEIEGQHQDIVVETKEATDKNTDATISNTKAKEGATVAARAQADAERAAAAAVEAAAAAQRGLIAESGAKADALVAEIDHTKTLVAAVKQLDETERDRVVRQAADMDAGLKQQISVNAGMGLSTSALEDSRVALREQTRAKLQAISDAEIADVRTADAAKTESARASADAIVATYGSILSSVGDIASELGSRSAEALASTRSELEGVQAALDGLSTDTVSAATLSGEALVQAYKDGEIAAENLSNSQQKFVKDRLQAEKKALKEKEAAEKKAAMAAFVITQAVAIVQTIIATAQGVMSAFQLGPVAGAVAAAAIGVLGATQVGLIASQKPQLHDGGFLAGGRAAPDERDVRMTTQEAMLTGQGRAIIGDDAIRMANAGRTGGSGGSGGVIVYKHRAFEYFVADHIRTNGTLARTIRTGDRVGYVRRGRGR